MANSCIITGATGYIGSHLLKYLLKKGWDVHIIADSRFGYDNISDVISKIDVFEYDGLVQSLCDYFQNTQADVVFHLAAAVITNYRPEQVPVLIQSNIQFGTEILEAMKQSGIKKIVTTGSYWQNYNSDDYNPVDLYAATKEAFEKIVKYYVDAFEIRHINLRLYDVYGEDDHRPKLLNIIRDIADTGEQLELTPGMQMLDMVHISDVCTAYEAAFELLTNQEDVINDTFGVRTGEMFPLKEIIALFVSQINKPVNLVWGGKPYKNREVMMPCVVYKKLPNWDAKISLTQGLSLFK